MGLERTLWTWFHNGVKHLVDLDIQRIESPISPGIPDVEGCKGVVSFWIELKACARPKRLTTLLNFDMKNEQAILLKRRWRVGGKCYILVRVGEKREAKVYLITGRDVDKLKRCTEPELWWLSAVQPKLDPVSILKIIIGPRYSLVSNTLATFPNDKPI